MRLRSNKMNKKTTSSSAGWPLLPMLDYEVVDNIVKGTLLKLYEELKDTQGKGKTDFDNLQDFQKEDYKYNEALLEATKILICYYTTSEERPEELIDL